MSAKLPAKLPSRLNLSVMKSNILPLLRLTNDRYYISLHGLLVRDPPAMCPPSSFVFSLEDVQWPKLFPNNTRSTISMARPLVQLPIHVPRGHSMGQEHGVVVQFPVARSCIMGVCHVAEACHVGWSPSACCRCAAWGEAGRQTCGRRMCTIPL
jgi:hypothetical protein